MKEFVENLIDKLGDEYLSQDMRDWNNAILRAVEIVYELAEKYNNASTDISTKQLKKIPTNHYTERFNKVM